MRKLNLLMMVILLLPIAVAQYEYDECQRVQDPNNLPCIVISTWRPADCAQGQYEVHIFNESDILVRSYNWTNLTSACFFTFNETTLQTYVYNSSMETGAITLEGSNVFLIAILLIPLGLSFLFLYWGATLSEEQEPIKWFMRLLSLIMIFVLFAGANIVIALNPRYAALQDIFNFTWIKWIFFSIMAIFLTYFIYRIALAMRTKSKEDFRQGILK